MDMFKIGDFSKFTRVSIKMLRYYDEIGLLKPDRIDPESGYRYYSAGQLPRLNQIILFKDLGFSMEQIKTLLNEHLSPDELKGMLRLRKAEIQQQIEEDKARLAQLEAQIYRFDEKHLHPGYDIILREVADRWVASIRTMVKDQTEVAGLFDQVEDFAAEHSVRASASPMMIFHDADFRDENLDIEVAVPITQPVSAGPSVQVRRLPGAPAMACAVYIGSYDQTPDVLGSIMVWMEANQYRMVGPYREVYIRFGADREERLIFSRGFLAGETDSLVTEIQIPVEKLAQTVP